MSSHTPDVISLDSKFETTPTSLETLETDGIAPTTATTTSTATVSAVVPPDDSQLKLSPAKTTTRFALLRDVLKDIGISPCEEKQDLCYLRVDRDTLLDPATVTKLINHRDVLKQAYSTAKLSCLHSNGVHKQKTPGVCLVRQLLKANGIRMVPQTESIGYDSGSGKKLVRRWYLLTPI